ncbi:MAG: hypothetical protein WCK05_17055, partial [Planctomycetota bacterium]
HPTARQAAKLASMAGIGIRMVLVLARAGLSGDPERIREYSVSASRCKGRPGVEAAGRRKFRPEFVDISGP